MGMKHLCKCVNSQLWISHFNSNFIGLSQVKRSSYSVHKNNYFRKNLWLAIRQITHLLFLLVGQPIKIILVVVLFFWRIQIWCLPTFCTPKVCLLRYKVHIRIWTFYYTIRHSDSICNTFSYFGLRFVPLLWLTGNIGKCASWNKNFGNLISYA